MKKTNTELRAINYPQDNQIAIEIQEGNRVFRHLASEDDVYSFFEKMNSTRIAKEPIFNVKKIKQELIIDVALALIETNGSIFLSEIEEFLDENHNDYYWDYEQIKEVIDKVVESGVLIVEDKEGFENDVYRLHVPQEEKTKKQLKAEKKQAKAEKREKISNLLNIIETEGRKLYEDREITSAVVQIKELMKFK